MAQQVANLRIGDKAPNFQAASTMGDFDMYEHFGDSWGILFSHPADFTPVCATELAMANNYMPQFESRNCKLAAYSCDNVESHNRWKADIEELSGKPMGYPIVDGEDREVAITYGMLDQELRDAQGLPLTIRSVYIVDPNKTIKLILTYPAPCGRNFDELIRVLDSLQMTANQSIATPANWQPGEACAILPSVSNEEANERFGEFEAKFPYLRLTTGYDANVQGAGSP